ncbi:MAG: ornithine cyclodeaminase family protein [Eubacteriales bacterium]|nr:ornithine cyclodeaminase family protein [Eubacteriales bacterium]
METYTKELLAEKERIEKRVKIGSEVLYLTKAECMQNGPTVQETIDAVRETFIAHGKKDYEMPAKIGVHPHADVFYHAMPAYVPGQMAMGCKCIECYPRNPKDWNLPQTSSVLVLNEIITGYQMAIMDGAWVTAMRTPAVTAVSAESLCPDAEAFGMFGCGVQGQGHVRFIVHTLKKLKKIYIYDAYEPMMDKLIENVGAEVPSHIQIIKAKTPKEVVDNCDALCSATKITRDTYDIVKKEWLRPGLTIFPMDLNSFWEASIQRDADKYFVDSRDEHELFASMGYFPEGLPHIVCETGEIIAGLHEGRTSKDEIIVCSNIGISVFDIAFP